MLYFRSQRLCLSSGAVSFEVRICLSFSLSQFVGSFCSNATHKSLKMPGIFSAENIPGFIAPSAVVGGANSLVAQFLKCQSIYLCPQVQNAFAQINLEEAKHKEQVCLHSPVNMSRKPLSMPAQHHQLME